MKKLFTMMAVGVVAFAMNTATAGTPLHAEKGTRVLTTVTGTPGYSSSLLRSSGCDTLLNETAQDTPTVYLSGSPNEGYFSGNGAIDGGGTYYPIVSIGEEYTTTVSTPHVTAAFVVFGVAIIKPTHADSAITITAYVYDTTGTSQVFNEIAPGNALDSATVTLGSIANDVANQSPTYFRFTHQPVLPGSSFFVATTLPQSTGDTLAVVTNLGTTGDGNGWLEVSAGALSTWASYDSLTGGQQTGNYIFASVCSSASSSCGAVTVTATQHNHTAVAAVTSGGVAPYTYSWSSNPTQTTDTATGLAAGTYTVTVTDHNGCTGTASVTINTTGIASINAGISDFSVFPNPSNGQFTAALHLETASDVTISILDVTGNKVFESTDKAVTEMNKAINLSTIAPGLYIVNVKTATGSVNQRLVINK